ncbi:MAG TPA: glycosyltransferase family 1 protein [Solirubrobacteraceae bacterium]|nr:glycosyltransferase family 1 protein [Solirubrobacteraceae bacterium]
MAHGPVLINARAAARPELGGVERWAREMVRRLPQLDPLGYEVARPPRRFVHRAGHAWEQGVLPAVAARRHAQLLLSPANLAPLAFPRNVVVLHDAAALRQPDWYSGLYAAWQRAILPALAKRALHVVTVSQFSRTELLDLLDLDPAKVTVIHGGVDERFHPQVEPARRARPYVLTVASRTARKNLGALRLTAERLNAQDGTELVVAGGDRPQFRDDDPTAGLTFLGHVDDADLPGLYAGARAFVLPSHYEGFGLTALEAMACGTPVVASDRTALPEVVGDAGLLVDPDDPEAIADAVLQALDDQTLARRGAARAQRFTWADAAHRVHALLSDLRTTRTA